MHQILIKKSFHESYHPLSSYTFLELSIRLNLMILGGKWLSATNIFLKMPTKLLFNSQYKHLLYLSIPFVIPINFPKSTWNYFIQFHTLIHTKCLAADFNIHHFNNGNIYIVWQPVCLPDWRQENVINEQEKVRTNLSIEPFSRNLITEAIINCMYSLL